MLSAGLALGLTAVRAVVSLHLLRVAIGDRIDVVVGIAWITAGVLLGWRRGRGSHVGKLALAMLLGIASGWWMIAHARLVALSVTHLHNLFAFVIWTLLFRRDRPSSASGGPRWVAVPIAIASLAALFLATGSYLSWTVGHGGTHAFGVRAELLSASLVPGLPSSAAVPLTVLFVFLQSTHYGIWTAWIPQDSLRGEGTPTFKMTVRSLLADFGGVGLAGVIALTLAFVGLAWAHLQQSVYWYMHLARAHVWFEAGAFAYLWGARRSRAPFL